MSNYDMPCSRLGWAMQTLRDAGISGQVNRRPDGSYTITVGADDTTAAGSALRPVQEYSRHPLIIEKKRRNFLVGWLGFTVVGLGGLALLAMSLLGVAPGLLTGIAVLGLAPVLIAGLGMPTLAIVVWLYMVNLRVPFVFVLGLLALWLLALGGSILASQAGVLP